jgi:predicted pyridoxine 5'-phosphate oxidase superfamily flavin-nucleotide-binding protein
MTDQHLITSLEALERIYGEPHGPALAKETDRITPHYCAFIEAAPFFALASSGSGGLDCSPRGDAPGFVRVQDEKTLLVPDRRGNNRIDTLRNILANPRVALLFLIPAVPRSRSTRSSRRASWSTARRRARCWSCRSRACSTSVRRRSCARSCGMPRVMSSAGACRAPARFWLISPAASSAVPSTTARHPNA